VLLFSPAPGTAHRQCQGEGGHSLRHFAPRKGRAKHPTAAQEEPPWFRSLPSCSGESSRGAQMSPKGRKSPSRDPEQGAPLSRKANPSPNLCLKQMEGSQVDPLHASHPCTREMPTARLSQTRSPAPRKTDPGTAGERLSCLSEGWHRGKAPGQTERAFLLGRRECFSHCLPCCLGTKPFPGGRSTAPRGQDGSQQVPSPEKDWPFSQGSTSSLQTPWHQGGRSHSFERATSDATESNGGDLPGDISPAPLWGLRAQLQTEQRAHCTASSKSGLQSPFWVVTNPQAGPRMPRAPTCQPDSTGGWQVELWKRQTDQRSWCCISGPVDNACPYQVLPAACNGTGELPGLLCMERTFHPEKRARDAKPPQGGISRARACRTPSSGTRGPAACEGSLRLSIPALQAQCRESPPCCLQAQQPTACRPPSSPHTTGGSRNPHGTQTQTARWHPCSWPQTQASRLPRSAPPHGAGSKGGCWCPREISVSAALTCSCLLLSRQSARGRRPCPDTGSSRGARAPAPQERRREAAHHRGHAGPSELIKVPLQIGMRSMPIARRAVKTCLWQHIREIAEPPAN